MRGPGVPAGSSSRAVAAGGGDGTGKQGSQGRRVCWGSWGGGRPWWHVAGTMAAARGRRLGACAAEGRLLVEQAWACSWVRTAKWKRGHVIDRDSSGSTVGIKGPVAGGAVVGTRTTTRMVMTTAAATAAAAGTVRGPGAGGMQGMRRAPAAAGSWASPTRILEGGG